MATFPIPADPVVNAGYLDLQGLNLSYLTTTTLSVAAGQARDSTNSNDIVSSAAVTVSLAVQGAGGIDQGTVAASTLYNVYVIGSSMSRATTSVVLSTQASSTGPLLPTNYDMYRRIGCIAVDGSSHVRAFFQTGAGHDRVMHYQVPVAPGSAATSGSATYATIGTLTTLVPAQQCEVLLSGSMDSNTAGNTLYVAPYGNVAVASNGFAFAFSSSVTTAPQVMSYTCPCALNSGAPEIVYATTEASDAVTFLVRGYVDQLYT